MGLLIAVCLATMWFLPGPARPAVSIRFVSYTNDPTGDRVGLILVQNIGSQDIFFYAPRTEVPAPTKPGGIAWYGKPCQWAGLISSGGSQYMTIQTPTNGSPWRVSSLVYNDLGAAQSVRRLVRERRMPFDVPSAWVYSDK
jgi:hypothetical protein